jgi:hypothetical protein
VFEPGTGGFSTFQYYPSIHAYVYEIASFFHNSSLFLVSFSCATYSAQPILRHLIILTACKEDYSSSYITILFISLLYCAALKRLATPSDFHTPLHSTVPFAHSETYFTHGCIYPIFPGSSGTTSFFPSFRFPVDHNVWQSHWVQQL